MAKSTFVVDLSKIIKSKQNIKKITCVQLDSNLGQPIDTPLINLDMATGQTDIVIDFTDRRIVYTEFTVTSDTIDKYLLGPFRPNTTSIGSEIGIYGIPNITYTNNKRSRTVNIIEPNKLKSIYGNRMFYLKIVDMFGIVIYSESNDSGIFIVDNTYIKDDRMLYFEGRISVGSAESQICRLLIDNFINPINLISDNEIKDVATPLIFTVPDVNTSDINITIYSDRLAAPLVLDIVDGDAPYTINAFLPKNRPISKGEYIIEVVTPRVNNSFKIYTKWELSSGIRIDPKSMFIKNRNSIKYDVLPFITVTTSLLDNDFLLVTFSGLVSVNIKDGTKKVLDSTVTSDPNSIYKIIRNNNVLYLFINNNGMMELRTYNISLGGTVELNNINPINNLEHVSISGLISNIEVISGVYTLTDINLNVVATGKANISDITNAPALITVNGDIYYIDNNKLYLLNGGPNAYITITSNCDIIEIDKGLIIIEINNNGTTITEVDIRLNVRKVITESGSIVVLNKLSTVSIINAVDRKIINL